MSIDPNQAPSPDQPDKTPARPKRRRRWPVVLGGLLLVLVLLVVLLPTIASTSPARSFVLGKINEQINGRVEIDGWSVGWFSPTTVTGIKVYDENQQLIVSVPRVRLGLSVLSAIRQDFALGNDNVVDVDSFVMRVDEQHKTNLERLPKTTSASRSASGAVVSPAHSGSPVRVPNLSGTFTVNFRGTVESGAGEFPPVHVRDSTAQVKIPDINQPITSDLKIAYQLGESEVSTFETSGTTDAIRNNLLNLDQFAAAHKLSFKDVKLEAIAPILKKFGVDLQVAGVVNGGIDLKAQGFTGLSSSGQIVVRSVNLGGPLLNGDSFKTTEITIPLNITRTATAGGDALIKFENVGVKMNQASIAVVGQVPESALRNLQANKAPGADGSITITADVTDLKDLASQFKNTLKLQEGVAVTGGSGHEQLAITLTKDEVRVTQDLKLSATGTRGGQRIELKPITVTASAVARPTGQTLPDIRNVKLNVDSSFATITGGGDSIAKLAIAGKVALDALSTELSQFIDMQKMQLQGSADFAINTDGDLTNESAPVHLSSKLNFQNVKVVGLMEQPIDQDRLAVQASGTLVRDKNVPVKVDQMYATVVGGDPASPLIDFEVNGIVDLKDNSVPWFEIKKGTITSLPRLQQQYGGLVPVLAQQKLKIESGALYVSAGGSYAQDTLTFSKAAGVSIPTLTLSREGKTILNREVIRASINGKLTLKDGVAGEFTDLSVTTDSKMLMLNKGGQGPLKFTMIKSAVQGNGEMTLSADLKRLSDLAQAFGGSIAVSPDQPQVTGGGLNGTIVLTKASQPQTDLKFNGQITGLTIANAAGPIAQNEQLTFNLAAIAPDDLVANPISANAKVTGSFINATVSDAKISTTGSTLDMLRSAVVDAQVTDLAKAYAVASAATGSRAPTTGPALPPLQITSGSAAFKANVVRDGANKATTITVSEARVNNLALKRGTRTFAFDSASPITAKLNAVVRGTDSADALDVKELSADARIATLTMSQPIVITGLQTDKKAFQGAVSVQGKLESATPLLAMLQQADPMPYAGSYAATQKISTRPSDNVVTLDGTIDIRDFRVMSGNRPAFSEPQVAIRNDVDLDPNGKKLNAKTLTLSMPQSQALGLSFTGGVNDWEKARTIRPNTKLDLVYDLEKVWTIVRPMLSPEQQATYKDLKVAGKYQKSFALSGAFPEGPMDRSFAALNADGSIAIDLLDTMGLNIQKFQPVVKMTRGKAVITGTPAVLNDGSLDVSEIVIDMTKPAPELTVARNKRLVRNAKINPVLANSIGQFASAIFHDTKEAKGLLDLTVIECQQVPVSDLMNKGDRARAKIVYSIRDIQLNGFIPGLMADVLDLGTRGLVGQIPESTVGIEGGRVTSDMTFEIARAGEDRRGQQVIRQVPLKFNGGVGLKDLRLHDFQAVIPKDLIPSKWIPADVRGFVPPEIRIPITGTLTKIDRPDIPAAIAATLNPFSGQGNRNPLENLGGSILDQLRGGGRENPPPDQRPRNRGQ